MVLLQIIQAATEGQSNDATEAGQAAFFGFIGIASALVFASKYLKI
jgi:hypothetical protein